MQEKRKDTVISTKTYKSVKLLLKAAADAEHRTESNMLEVMVMEWCTRKNIKVQKVDFEIENNTETKTGK